MHRRTRLLVVAAFLAQAYASEPSPPGQLIDLGGRRLHLMCAGTGSPTVLVESGGGSFSIEWTLVQSLVVTHTRICTYDRAGYAWSDRGPVDDGIEQIVDDLSLLVRKARITPPFILVGHSLGALYARAYQRRFPENVGAFVFVDGTHDENITMMSDGVRKPISQLSREQLQRAHHEYLRSVPPLKAGPADAPPFDRLPAELQAARHWAFEKMVAEIGWLPNTPACAESWREEFSPLRRERLARTHPLGDLPLRVLERGKDSNPDWHAQQVQLAALASGGKLIKVEGSGHMIHLERPDVVAHAIAEVIDEVRKRK